MSSTARKLLVAGGVAAAAVASERVVSRRLRARLDPTTDHLLEPPKDVQHLTVPTHDGGSLHLIERGEGRPVLLIHGITLNAELWSPQLHELAGEFRVLALDQRGHGDSKVGDDQYTMSQLGRDIATVLTELDLRDALVVGHSMGGMATLNFAVDHPDVRRERVSGLGLVATAAARPFHPMLLPRLTAVAALLVERLDDGRPVPSFRFTGNDLSLFLCRTAFGKAPSAKAIEQVRASIEATDEEAIQRCLAGIIVDHDTTDRLGDVDIPAFVVVGSRDLLTPVPFARIIAEALPDAELTILPQAGHQLMQERPAEIAGLVRDLSDRTRTRPGVTAAVEGVRVGHWTDVEARTGCTVVLLPEETVASAEVRGGAPASRDLDLLAPERLVDRVDAVLLTGGSAFGLAAADGVMRWLEDRGRGFRTGAGPVPIVPTLGLYDLRVGSAAVRPGPAEGRAACDAAREGDFDVGTVGAGTGAMVGGWQGPDALRPGGLGSATVTIGDLVVTAVVAVNAHGSIDVDGSATQDDLALVWGPEPSPIGHTTIGAIVTNARLDKVGCLIVAQGGHDGLARSLVPAHTRVDGDALVAAATGRVEAAVDQVRLLAVVAVERAVRSVA